MSDTDFRKESFKWELLTSLYSIDFLSKLDTNLTFNQFQVDEGLTELQIFLQQIVKEKDDHKKAYQVYTQQAKEQLDPLSSFRLAECYSMNTNNLSIPPDFTQTWYHLLIYTITVYIKYGKDFFNGQQWLQKIIKQADPTLTNSQDFLSSMLDKKLSPLFPILLNLLKLSTQVDVDTPFQQQDKYNLIIEQTQLLLSPTNSSTCNQIQFIAYDILLGFSLQPYPQIDNKQQKNIFRTLAQNSYLLYRKALLIYQEMQIAKCQKVDNFFSVRSRRILQQLYWILLEAKKSINLSQKQQQNEEKDRNYLQQASVFIQQALESSYINTTVNDINELLVCRRYHSHLLYKENNLLKQSLAIIRLETKMINSNQLNNQNNANSEAEDNSHAYAEYLSSRIRNKLGQSEQQSKELRSSEQYFLSRLKEQQNSIENKVVCLYYLGRISSKLYQDDNKCIEYFKEVIDQYQQPSFTNQLNQWSFQLIYILNQSIKFTSKIYSRNPNAGERQKQFPSQIKEVVADKNGSSFFLQTADKKFFQGKEVVIFGKKSQVEVDKGIEKKSIIQLSPFRKSIVFNNNNNLEKTIDIVLERFEKNGFKMIKLINNDIKIMYLLNKDEVCNIYACKVFDSQLDYLVKVVSNINSKQVDEFIQFQNNLPISPFIQSIMGYSVCYHRNGLIDMYLVSSKHQTNLSQLLKSSEGISLLTKIQFSNKLLHAIEILHRNNISHNYLNDTNIICNYEINSSNIQLQICDLSINRLFRDSEFGEHQLKQPYCSPEQLEDSTLLSQQNDIWAIGILFLQFFTNIPQFDNKEVQQINIYNGNDYQVTIEQFPQNQEVSQLEKLIANLIQSLLKQNPKKRFSVAQSLQSLEQIQQYVQTVILKSK